MELKEIKELIEGNALALATVDSAGNPHVIGVACVKIVGDDEILITDNYMNNTLKNLQGNRNVGLAVWDKDWKGYGLKGTAEYFSEGEWVDKVKGMEENKGMPAKGAIIVKVSEIKKSG